MKKVFITAVAIALAVFMAFGCGKAEEPAQPSQQPVELTNTGETAPTQEPPAEPEVEEEQGYVPDEYSPTTGMVDTTTEYKPVIVQIENEPPARPQRGIQWADIVYETMIEGIDTRFTCIFNDIIYKADSPEEIEVGPVRSSRYYHQWIQGEWDGLYVHVAGRRPPIRRATYGGRARTI
jgi:hypothetical protein